MLDWVFFILGRTYVEIQVVGAEGFEGLLETGCDVVLVRVPELAGYEDLFAGYTAVFDTLAYFVLVSCTC